MTISLWPFILTLQIIDNSEYNLCGKDMLQGTKHWKAKETKLLIVLTLTLLESLYDFNWFHEVCLGGTFQIASAICGFLPTAREGNVCRGVCQLLCSQEGSPSSPPDTDLPPGHRPPSRHRPPSDTDSPPETPSRKRPPETLRKVNNSM